jgi:acetylornithine deacetylase
MSHFRRIGAEAVILGPGDIARCHKPDEWVGIDELTAAAKAYTALLRRILAA